MTPVGWIFSKIKRYTLETGLIGSGIITVLIIMLTSSPQTASRTKATLVKNDDISAPYEKVNQNDRIMVDIEGAVTKPGVYQIHASERMRDIIDKAGGFSSDADRSFIAKNMNLSRILRDQDKVYIPRWGENIPIQPVTAAGGKTVHINSAPANELETLPRIGKTAALKIIQNRPYESLDELVAKHVITQTIYDQIKSQIDL